MSKTKTDSYHVPSLIQKIIASLFVAAYAIELFMVTRSIVSDARHHGSAVADGLFLLRDLVMPVVATAIYTAVLYWLRLSKRWM